FDSRLPPPVLEKLFDALPIWVASGCRYDDAELLSLSVPANAVWPGLPPGLIKEGARLSQVELVALYALQERRMVRRNRAMRDGLDALVKGFRDRVAVARIRQRLAHTLILQDRILQVECERVVQQRWTEVDLDTSRSTLLDELLHLQRLTEAQANKSRWQQVH